ncbi:MAG: outer membrane lipoprotein chaperone LolA [Mariprofundales bacterium]
MMKHKFLALILCCITPMFAMANAAEPLPALLLQSLKKLNTMDGFSAIFTQTITYQNGTTSRYSGTIAVQRPGKFRWHYSKPYAQTYVSDGSTIWHYEPDLMQAVQMRELSSVDPIAMQLLDGRIHPQELTLISKPAAHRGSIEGALTQDFRVRIHNTIALTLTLDRQGTLIGITHNDLLGNSNHIALTAMRTDLQDRAQFHFTPPKGVDIIIEGEQP